MMVGDVDIEDGSLPELVDDDAEDVLLCVRIWRKTISGLGGGLDEVERGRAVWVAGGERKAVEDPDDDDTRGRKGRARGL